MSAIGRKYGQESALHPPHLLGGFGQLRYLLPGTGIALVPSELTDDEVAPVNCGVSTMAAVTEAAAIEPGDTVAVFGAGLLGLYGVAMARVKAADHVVAIDGVAARRASPAGSVPTRPARRMTSRRAEQASECGSSAGRAGRTW